MALLYENVSKGKVICQFGMARGNAVDVCGYCCLALVCGAFLALMESGWCPNGGEQSREIKRYLHLHDVTGKTPCTFFLSLHKKLQYFLFAIESK